VNGEQGHENCQQALRAGWPDMPASENPVGYVTNSVHAPTFCVPRGPLVRRASFARLARPDLDHELMAKILDIPTRSSKDEPAVKSEMLRVARAARAPTQAQRQARRTSIGF
jgi:hypothetical protein